MKITIQELRNVAINTAFTALNKANTGIKIDNPLQNLQTKNLINKFVEQEIQYNPTWVQIREALTLQDKVESYVLTLKKLKPKSAMDKRVTKIIIDYLTKFLKKGKKKKR